MSKAATIKETSPRAAEYRGLCACCENSLVCTYQRDPDQPVLMCEEFVAHSNLQVEIRFRYVGEAPQQPERDDTERYKGLCVNCERRRDCSYAKTEEGVWHCDEYA